MQTPENDASVAPACLKQSWQKMIIGLMAIFLIIYILLAATTNGHFSI